MKDYLQKKWKYVLSFLLMLMAASGSWAQTLSVTGKVSDDKGEGLPGVTVLLKGTSIGTSTDPAGKYSLNVPNGDGTLVISFIGYNTQEVAVNNRTSINVTLSADVKSLEEVVVVGYGTQRKRDITSAVSNINMGDIGEVPASNVTRLIQGQAPGVAVKKKNGNTSSAFEGRGRSLRYIGAGGDRLYDIGGC